MRRTLVAMFVMATACSFHVDFGATAFRCDQTAECPSGQSCSAGFCQTPGGGGGGPADARLADGPGTPIIDAAPMADAGCTGVCSVDTLIDGFDGAAPGPLWAPYTDPGCTVTVSGGSLRITHAGTSGAYCGVVSSSRYNFSAGTLTIDTAGLVSSGGLVTYFQVFDSAGRLEFQRSEASGQFRMNRITPAGSTQLTLVTYNIALHRYWRFRGQAPNVVFQTSGDAVTWTDGATAVPPFDIQRASVEFGAGQFQAGTNVVITIPGVNAP